MKIVSPSFEIITPIDSAEILKMIEEVGRTCYKSEDKITDELIETMAAEEKICNYIDIPIQHSSDRILKAMNRKSTKLTIMSTISKLRTKMPDINIRTTLITGFPGETKEDFELFSSLKGKKIMIRGNHDYWWKSISAVRSMIPKDFYAIQNDAIKFGDFIVCGTRLWNLPDSNKSMSVENEKIFKRELIRLEMTLQNAKKLQNNDEKIICMLHYPPYSFKEENNEVTDLIEKYSVDKVVYGHIHSYCKQNLVLKKNKTTYYLTSCDVVGNKLVEIY